MSLLFAIVGKLTFTLAGTMNEMKPIFLLQTPEGFEVTRKLHSVVALMVEYASAHQSKWGASLPFSLFTRINCSSFVHVLKQVGELLCAASTLMATTFPDEDGIDLFWFSEHRT